MAYDRKSILQQYPTEITDILRATTADRKDKTARMKVATILARALSFTKIRTGEDRTLRDTEIYKLAMVIRQAQNQENFDELLHEALPKARSRILEKYNLEWNLPWSPEQGQEKKPRKRRGRKTEVSETVPDIGARIDALEQAINQIQSQLPDIRAKLDASGTRKLARQLDEVLQKLKAHQHDREDGKAYILEKREL
jgi:hypothetical protein